MEKIVYILGAGFSAPLNLPVMSNFLEKSKDMFAQSPTQYSYFKNVFDNIRDMSYAKNFYECDLTNIEEILSILEMQSRFGKKKSKKSFIQFITDVIEYYTPDISCKTNDLQKNWYEHLFDTELKKYYGFFIASLVNIQIRNRHVSDHTRRFFELEISAVNEKQFDYTIITLNYDLIIEKYIALFNCVNRGTQQIVLKRDLSEDLDAILMTISKLHGSIDTKNIIPPTWNKVLDTRIQNAWKLAFNLLQTANHIRILGYSLPETDSYIKYLLKSSVIFTPHLKTIDVICKDNKQQSVQNRYLSFIDKKILRFFDGSIEDYLKTLYNIQKKNMPNADVGIAVFNNLEHAHKEFFDLNYMMT